MNMGLFKYLSKFQNFILKAIKSPPIGNICFSILFSSSASKIHSFCAIFLQATVRQPVVDNMLKALYFQFTAGVLPMYAVTFVGYWAYGSSTSTYLLNSVTGSVWVKAMANIAAFLQTVIALHVLVLIPHFAFQKFVIIFLLLH